VSVTIEIVIFINMMNSSLKSVAYQIIMQERGNYFINPEIIEVRDLSEMPIRREKVAEKRCKFYEKSKNHFLFSLVAHHLERDFNIIFIQISKKA
jgi:hypothetical protein